jgi:hypothetical protein
MRSSSEAALCENDDGAAIKTMIKEKKNLLRISKLQLMKQKSRVHPNQHRDRWKRLQDDVCFQTHN